MTAQDLHSVVRHLQHHFVGGELGQGGEAGGVFAAVEAVGCFPHLQAHTFDLHRHFGQHEGDALAVGNGFAKGGAFLGIGQRVLVGGACLSDGQRRRGDAGHREQTAETDALQPAQSIRRGDLDAVKPHAEDGQRPRPHHGDTVDHGHAHRPRGDDKRLGAVAFLGVDEEGLGLISQRHHRLHAVDHVVVALLFRRRRQCGRIKLVDRLDQRRRGLRKILIAEAGQEFYLLLLCAKECYGQRKEVRRKQME